MDSILKISDFKCFGKNAEGFETLKSINLILGRNNIGKSSLLELVRFAIEGTSAIQPGANRPGRQPTVHFSALLGEEHISSVFSQNTSGGHVPGRNHLEFGRQWIGERIHLNMRADNSVLAASFEPKVKLPPMEQASRVNSLLATLPKRPLQERAFVKLAAERNIRPEPDGTATIVAEDGVGATNLIRLFLTHASYARRVVANDLLAELNKIFGDDGKFEAIHALELPDQRWEIFLTEENKGDIPLSQSGSGLKTILLVLVLLHMVPLVTPVPKAGFVYAFEELENNLHPAALRRLLTYVRDFAIAKGYYVFLTSHSNAAIDIFARDSNAQILHVVKDAGAICVRTVKTYFEHKGILDDLDVRASDLLQANGIIWVEGPSDRIYINRLIDVATDGRYREGVHYQVVFYGGRLLSHLTAADPAEAEALINVLAVNRNTAIVIDSDRRTAKSRINDTKKRMLKEVEDNGGIAWITKGREIENYISPNLLARVFKYQGTIPAMNPHDDFFDDIEKFEIGRGKYWRGQKPLLAERVAEQMTNADLFGVLDLEERVSAICRHIGQWNRM